MSTLIHTFRTFAYEHDDLPAFHAGYLVLTLLAAALFNLGAFGILILAHVCLDFMKYRGVHRMTVRDTAEGILRESLVDITLFAIGLVFAVYLHHSVGVVSISGMLRADLSIIRAIGMFVPKVAVLHDTLKILAHIHQYIDQIHPRMRKGWSPLDHLCFYFLAVSLILLIVAVPLMGVSGGLVQEILVQELMPWRM